MVIHQSTDRAAINWQSFNVGKDAKVQFAQPSASSVTLNRVLSSDPSQIFGQITANGQVILTNPAGVYFGASARVDVGGIVATTHGMSDADFMAGKNRLERNGSTGKVVNEGEIKAALGGYIALLAPEVRNQGAVIAQMGTVALAAGEAFDLKFDSNNRLTSLRVEASQLQALVDNRLAVQAPGGLVIISAQSMDRLVGGVVKNSGTIDATGFQQIGGRIVLSGSTKAENSGTLTASNAQGSGGNVSLQGENIELKANSRIDVTGSTGGGTVLVGGNWQGSFDPLLQATGQPSQQAITVTMASDATIDASATQNANSNGNGGTVVLWSDIHNSQSVTTASGTLLAKGGTVSGRGGQIETSGQSLKVDGIRISTEAPQGATGTWLLDPYDITISSDPDAGTTGTYTATANSAVVNVSTLEAALASSNVTVTTGSSGTQNGDITVANAINVGGTGLLTLNASRGIVLNADITRSGTGGVTFISGVGGLTGAGGLSLTGGANLTVSQTGSSTYSGLIAGTGTLTKNGAGALTLAGNNSYTGSTTINNGTLAAGISSTGAAGAVTAGPFGTGTLIFSANSTGVLDVAGQTINNTAQNTFSPSDPYRSGTITNSTGTGTFGGSFTASGRYALAASNNATLLHTGTVTGQNQMYKTGVGTVELNGTSYQHYSIHIENGIVKLGNANAMQKINFFNFPSSSGLSHNGGIYVVGGTLDLNGQSFNGRFYPSGSGYLGQGALINTSSTNSAIGGDLYWSTGSAFTAGGTGNVNYYGYGPSSGTGTITKVGAGMFTWNPSYYGDGTALVANEGTLAFNPNAGDAVVNQNATLRMISYGTYSRTISGAGNLEFDGGSQKILTGAINHTGTTTMLTGGSVKLTRTGTLSRSFINNGFLSLESNGALTVSGNLTGTGSTTFDGTGTFTLTGNNSFDGYSGIGGGGVLVINQSTALGGTGTFAISNSSTLRISGGITLARPLSFSNLGSLISESGNNTISRTISVNTNAQITANAGTLTLAPTSGDAITGTNRSLTIAGAGDVVIGGTINTGSGSLTKNGSGTLTLQGANTYTGITEVNQGILHAKNNTALGTVANGTNVANGAILRIGSDSADLTIGAEALTLASGAVVNNVVGNNTYAGNVTLNGDASVVVDANSSLSFIASTGVQSVAANYGVTLVANGNIGWTKPLTGGGNLVLVGNGTFTGDYSALTGDKLVAAALPLYIRFNDPTGTDFSSAYGSTPDYTLGFFTAATGGQRVNAVKGIDYNISTLTINGSVPTASSAVGNYELAYGSGLTFSSSAFSLAGVGAATTWNVTPKPLTLTGSTVANKVYDGNANATLSNVGTLTGVLAGDAAQVSLNAGATATFADKHVGTGKLVTVGNLTLSGMAASNYVVTSPGSLVANITQRPTVAWTGAAGNTNWFDANNWDNGVLPDRSNVAAVSLAAGTSVNFNAPVGEQTVTVTGLNLGGGTFSQSGGTLNIGASGLTVGGLNQTAGTLAVTGTLSLAIPVSLGGTLSSTGAMTLSGAVSLTSNATLSTSNQAINLTGSIDSDASPRSLTVNAGTGNVTVSGSMGNTSALAGLSITGGQITQSGNVVLDTGGIFSLSNSGTSTMSGQLSGSAASLTKSGNGSLAITNDQIFTGATTINAGTVTLGNGGASGSLSGNIVNNGTLAFARSDSALNLAGSISGTGGVNTGTTGTVTLSGNNSYSGTTTVQAGSTLVLAHSNALGNTTGATTVSNGATLALQGDITVNESVTLNGTGAAANGGALRNLSGNNSITGPITLVGAGRINSDAGELTIDVTSGNAIAASGMNLTLGGAGGITIADPISTGTGSLTKDGTGRAILSGNNTYSGTTNVQNGTLVLAHNNALGTSAGGVTVTGGASLAVQGGITVNEAITLNGGGVANGGALRNLSGNNSISGQISLASDTRINSDAGELTIDVASGNAITASNRSLTLGGAASIKIADPISIGTGTLTKDGSGTTTLQSNNTFTGTTTISDGVLQLGVGGSTGSVASSSIINNAKLVINRNTITTLANNISGTGALEQAGAGSLSLTGALTYTGPTTMTGAGTLTAGAAVNIATLSPTDVANLNSAQLSLLSPTQIAAITPAQATALSTTQLTSLTTTQLAALAPASLTALSNVQLSAITPTQIASLAPAQLVALTSTQLANLSSAQIASLSPTQLASLNATQLAALTPANPASLTNTQLAALAPVQLANFSTAQLATLNPSQIAAITPTQAAALSTTQLASLTTTQLAALAPSSLATLSNVQLSAITPPQIASLAPAQMAALTSTQLASLSTAQLASFSMAQAASLSTSQLANLSAAQLASLRTAQQTAPVTDEPTGSTTADLSLLTNNQIAALAPAQLANLSNTQLAALSPTQITAITPAQAAALSTTQLASLTTTQLAALAPASLTALSNVQLGAITPTQIASFTPSQLAALNPAQLANLSSAQLAFLSPAQLASLNATQLAALTPANPASLTNSQITALAPAQLANLSSTQLAALSPTQITAITPAQAAALSTTQLASLTTTQLAALAPASLTALSNVQLGAITPTQIASLSPAQKAALTSTQRASLSTAQLAALNNAQTTPQESAEQAVLVAQSMIPRSTMPGTNLSSAIAPKPLEMSPGTAITTSSMSSSGTLATASMGNNSAGVTVDMRSTSQPDTPTLVGVSLPKGSSTVGTGFSFQLPESLRGAAADGAAVQVNRDNGNPMPNWLKFDPSTLSFEANAVPDSGLPLQLVVTVAGQRVMVVISERTE
jgi:filamentous hemagglutinin family protein